MFFRMWSYVWRHKWLFFIGTFFILINAVATVAPAEWGGQVLKELLAQSDSGRLIVFGLAALVIFTAKLGADFMRRYLMGWLGQLINADMQKEFHAKVLRLPVSYFRQRQIGDLISRTTNDIGVVRSFLGANMMSIINDPLVLAIGLTRLFVLNWLFSLELLAAGILIAVLVQVTGNLLRRVMHKLQAGIGDITSSLQQSLFSIEIIKIFHREKFHRDKFDGRVGAYLENARREVKINSFFRPAVDFVGFLGGGLVIGTGAYMISGGHMKIDELFTFMMYIATLSSPLNAVTGFFVSYKGATAAAERFFEVIDAEEEKYQEGGKALPPVAGRVEFRGVHFAYRRGEPVLRGIDLVAEPGQVIAIVGGSGGGKTTLVNLIPRLLESPRGRVLIDGHDVRKVTLESLRSQIGMVTQDNILFPGTVYENILYGKLEATKAEVEEAARIANAHDFITEFPRGYATQIGERGLMISGGQRQRLALARAILKRPRIMILDEATSALDTESEKLVQNALAGILHLQTTFVIAHRLSTVVEADQIIVLDQGRIVERGAHRELIKRKGSAYRRLYEMQFQG